MEFRGSDKVWLAVNTADYVAGLMLDTMLYDLYSDEVTGGAYSQGKIRSMKDFKQTVRNFCIKHQDDYQIGDILEIYDAIELMVNRLA